MSKTLAIRGDKERGNEVIALLEMLGGKNVEGYIGTDMYELYMIDDGVIIQGYDCNNCIIFTLDEFYKKYPYKVGDKVYLVTGESGTITGMLWNPDGIIYEFKRTDGHFHYIQRRYIDSLITNNNITDMETKVETTGFMQMGKTLAVIFNEENYEDEVELQLGDYEIVVRDGKTYAVKKKSIYPKTYEKCCELLFGNKSYSEWTLIHVKGGHLTCKGNFITQLPFEVLPYEEQIRVFYRLLICRDAYWKIAGEQMGLGNHWEPDWNKETDKFTISNKCNKIYLYNTAWYSEVLAFPTAEMRDAFYDNFKDLIEQCKELL